MVLKSLTLAGFFNCLTMLKIRVLGILVDKLHSFRFSIEEVGILVVWLGQCVAFGLLGAFQTFVFVASSSFSLKVFV